jgi:hypothetical protein
LRVISDAAAVSIPFLRAYGFAQSQRPLHRVLPVARAWSSGFTGGGCDMLYSDENRGTEEVEKW